MFADLQENTRSGRKQPMKNNRHVRNNDNRPLKTERKPKKGKTKNNRQATSHYEKKERKK